MPNLPTSGSEYRSLIALLVVSAFIVAGGIHYQTPMLAAIAAEFHADPATTGWIPTLSFGGLVIGIALFVPLGDRFDKRQLILGKLVVIALAQAVMAVAPSIFVLAAGALVTGICSSVLQHFLAITAEVAHPNHRGRALGTQLTAMFSGILFARIFGGLIATHLGWRYSYMLSTGMLVLIIPVVWARLPHTRATTQAGYGALLRSLFALYREQGGIRRAATIQFMFGICYGGFWAVAAPMLALVHRVGPSAAGFMGIPGSSGILIARAAGRWTDRAGLRPVVLVGICSMIAAWVAMAFGDWSIVAIVIGAALLDIGLRAAMVANQTLINSAVPDSRGRSNTVFALHVWTGNSVGAFLASWSFANYGWLAVCGVAMTAIVIALLLHLSRGFGDSASASCD
ncbi:MAG TPA: MFS transporter [Burkholderiales bacterium]|nr:MFS transporter [Burkholderiales bacterium]